MRVRILVMIAAAGCASAPERRGAATLPGLPGGPPLVRGDSAEETYELNFVGIERTTIHTNNIFSPDTSIWRGFRGKYKQMLGPAEFYVAAGRSDLYDSARRHATAQAVLGGGGFVLVLGGGAYAVKDVGNTDGRTHAAGFAVAGTGLVMLLVAKAMTAQPTSEAEAVRMARDYNDRLRVYLGLRPIIEDPTVSTAALPRRSRARRPPLVAPAADPGGMGLASAQ